MVHTVITTSKLKTISMTSGQAHQVAVQQCTQEHGYNHQLTESARQVGICMGLGNPCGLQVQVLVGMDMGHSWGTHRPAPKPAAICV